jgi:TatD DNase family protein
MIDSHCHIYLDDFQDDLADVLARAAGITDILMPAISFASLPEMDRLSHPEIRFHKMAGIHPCEVRGNLPNLESDLFESASSDDIIGVGESGLDYYWSTDFVNEQHDSLRAHCRIAKTLKKPVVLHNRESTSDLLKIISEMQDGNLTGVWHCFNGTVDEGLEAIDLGLYLGIGGVITFKNAGVDKSVAKLPVNRLVLETDSPYLAPVPFRGKRNEPSFLALVAEKLAVICDVNPEEIQRITSDNTIRLFGLR